VHRHLDVALLRLDEQVRLARAVQRIGHVAGLSTHGAEQGLIQTMVHIRFPLPPPCLMYA
jgi:hypothetical protein